MLVNCYSTELAGDASPGISWKFDQCLELGFFASCISLVEAPWSGMEICWCRFWLQGLSSILHLTWAVQPIGNTCASMSYSHAYCKQCLQAGMTLQRSRSSMEARPLKGLGKEWESTDSVRRSLLWNGCLLQWADENSVGMASYQTAKMNFEVLRPLFTRWVKVTSEPRAMAIKPILKQARQA